MQRCRRPGGVAGVATGVVRSVVVVVVAVGGGAFQQVLPACGSFPLRVKGGGGGERTRGWRGGRGRAQNRSDPAQSSVSPVKPGFKCQHFNQTRSCVQHSSLTWGHRGQRSWDTKVRSSILEIRSQGGPYKASDWKASGFQMKHPRGNYGGCNMVPGFGTLDNVVGNWAR